MEIDARSPDGNAFVIMGYVRRLLRESGRSKEWPLIQTKMLSGDYENLCKVAEEATYGSIVVVNRDLENNEDE